MAQKIRGYAFRDIRRVEVPRGLGEDWTDYFQTGSTPENLETLLDRAPSLGLRLPELTCR